MITGTVDKHIVCALSMLQYTILTPLHHLTYRVCLQWPIGSDVVGINATYVTVNAEELKPGRGSVHPSSVTPAYDKQTEKTKENAPILYIQRRRRYWSLASAAVAPIILRAALSRKLIRPPVVGVRLLDPVHVW